MQTCTIGSSNQSNPASVAMGSAELDRAKLDFQITLFKQAPHALDRASIDAFFQLLTTATNECSRSNVQVGSIAHGAPHPP